MDDGVIKLLKSKGLDVVNVQDFEFSTGTSVGSGTSTPTLTAEETPDEQYIAVSRSPYVYNSATQRKHFNFFMSDPTTMAMEFYFQWDCNSCGTHYHRCQLYTLKSKPNKWQFVQTNSFPVTVEETDPLKTLIFNACGHYQCVPQLTDSTTLDLDYTGGSTFEYKNGFYLIDP